eukprot:TRINITY_DN2894_c0_g1_i1.p1 TRINITY_DN2894_c0_g1~~TRINITY_DN2894_c0_g1_i1.p1  ORF type:complete len:791 (+),score=114.80 TRINITY_DN2894_c0_g1_i1:1283-3655(+)
MHRSRRVSLFAAIASVALAERQVVQRSIYEVNDDLASCKTSSIWDDKVIAASYSHVIVDKAVLGAAPTCTITPPAQQCISAEKRQALQALGVQVLVRLGGSSSATNWAACLDGNRNALVASTKTFLAANMYSGIEFALFPNVDAGTGLLDPVTQPWATPDTLSSMYTNFVTYVTELKAVVPAANTVAVALRDADLIEGKSALFETESQLLNDIVDAVGFLTIAFGEVAFPGLDFSSRTASDITSSDKCIKCAATPIPTRACGCQKTALEIYEYVISRGNTTAGDDDEEQTDWTSKIVVGSCVGSPEHCGITGSNVYSTIFAQLRPCSGGFVAMSTENSFSIDLNDKDNEMAYNSVMEQRRDCLARRTMFRPKMLQMNDMLQAYTLYVPPLSSYTVGAGARLDRGRNQFYAGSRFDASSMLGQIEVSAKDRNGKLWWTHNMSQIPLSWDTTSSARENVFAFAEEWGCGKEGNMCEGSATNGILKWDGTGVDLTFMKIGVGQLMRPDAVTAYSSFESYPITRPLQWDATEVSDNSITLTASDAIGDANKYTLIRKYYENDDGMLEVEVTLQNTGTIEINTQHMAVNCLDMDRRALDNSYGIEFFGSSSPDSQLTPTLLENCDVCESETRSGAAIEKAARVANWLENIALVFRKVDDTEVPAGKADIGLSGTLAMFAFNVFGNAQRRYAPGMKKTTTLAAEATAVHVPKQPGAPANVCVNQLTTVTVAPGTSKSMKYTLKSEVSFKPALATSASVTTIIAFCLIFVVSIVAIVVADKFGSKNSKQGEEITFDE